MKLTYWYRLACKSFNKNFVSGHFTTNYIIKGFVVAFCLSLFIFLRYFQIDAKWLHSIIAIVGFYGLLKSNRFESFWIGFFIGIFWFYWIALSFRYYGLSYLIPFVILAIALVYGVIFRVIGAFENHLVIKTILIFLLSFIHPFGFNWLQPQLILSFSFFNPLWMTYAAFLIGILSWIKLPSYYKFIGLIFLLLATWNPSYQTPKNPLNIKITTSKIDQAKKWDPKYQAEILSENYRQIHDAITHHDDLIILPETAFPLYLNQNQNALQKLKKLSHDIDIIAGALSYQNQKIYNSTYFFHDGHLQIANKVVLVPFGEEIPLPSFIANFINKIFFDGSSDFDHAKKPHDFVIGGEKYRNAICFEATSDLLYQGAPRFMIAISNNAWFSPSTEPILQNILLRYYAKKYQTTIYHSANDGLSEIIKPQ
ncbi:apolipoprotein N-acyltransferase [Sulfurospirillum sp. 1612]|uniref:apolipoprotein N-acyltransferase n=1 Tax=Sulfurospirillum sp. 1612 TaxID=3094835 RepID=UPI002F93F7D8